MMLRVKGELTAAIASRRRGGSARGGPAAQVDHLDLRREEDPTTTGPDRRAEVHVLRSAHPQIQAEQRHPARMVLPVKRELARR